MLVLLLLVGLGMADQAVSAVWVNPLPDQPWGMGTGAGADPAVIGLFILGAMGVEIFRRLRRKGS
jgi:hypothetical protein